MRKLLLELDPVGGAAIHDAIQAETSRLVRHKQDDPTDHRTIEQLTADAISNLILNGQQALRPGTRELLVLVDYHHTLVAGLHDQSVHECFDGTHLTPETIRRIACDAHIIPIVLGAPGELLNAGREQRTATRQQRRALRAIYRTCAIDGCTSRYEHCELHHIIPWTRHGETNLHNLIPLCDRHHHIVHEGGCHLSINTTNRALTIHHPDGRVTIQPPPTGLAPPVVTAVGNHDPSDDSVREPVTRGHDADPDGPPEASIGEQPPPSTSPNAERPPGEAPIDHHPATLFDARPPPEHRAPPPADVA